MGLNEGPLQDQSSPGSAPERLRAVVEQVTYEEDGHSFISGTKVLQILTPFLEDLSSLRALSRGAPDDRLGVLNRATHLHACLHLASKMVQNGILGDFDNTIKLSTYAMAEIMSIVAFYATKDSRFKELTGGESVGTFVFGGSPSYLEPGSEVEAQMTRLGWCPSEIERLRLASSSLSTLHYISRLSRSIDRDHSSCDKASCKAFQIDLKTYKLSHVDASCTCPEFEINIADVQNVLRNTSTFPVLQFIRTDEGVELVVEEYKEGTEYVALSHVRLFFSILYVGFAAADNSSGLGGWAWKPEGECYSEVPGCPPDGPRQRP